MAKRRILIDSDFHVFADDHEALALLASLHRAGEIELAGLTTVTGNTWARTGMEHAAAAARELRLAELPIHEGAGQPLLHRQSDFAHRSRLYGAAFGGAWGNADLLEKQPSKRPAGYNGKTHAVNYLVDTIRASDRPITVLAIGPLTNLALALRIAPDIRDNIDAVVCMGGAFFVAGNVTPSAEFNWWFDAEAAAVVLEEDLRFVIVPLDATDRIVLDLERFNDWRGRFAGHPMFRRYHEPKYASVFAANPGFMLPVWDALAAACLVDESLVLREASHWVSVDCSTGPSYGRVVSFADAAEFNLSEPDRARARIVLEADAARFWEMYERHVFGH